MVDPTPLLSTERGIKQQKQGHRVLCCCDSRKAVLLFSLIALGLSIFGIISITLLDVPFTVEACVIYSVSIAFYLLVFFGAVTYHRCAVVLALIWELVAIALLIASAVMYDWASLSAPEQHTEKVWVITLIALMLAWRSLVVYSYFSFVSEVSSGIMSPETHDREKYSCCCNV
ncbi:hypothetical protein ACHAXH_000430 [Discostella pseudostelligera]